MQSCPCTIIRASARDRIERLHRNGLGADLGVPECARNSFVYEEAQALSLSLISTRRLLLQLLRLGETNAGSAIIARLGCHLLSHFAVTVTTLRYLG